MNGGVRAWARRHPRAVDAAVAGAVFLVNLPWIFKGGAPSIGLVLSVGLCAPFVFRRASPFGTFAVIVLVVFAQIALGWHLLFADALLLGALYGLAVRCDRWTSLSGAGIGASCVLLAEERFAGSGELRPGDLLMAFVLPVSAWLWGTTVRTRRAYVAALHERAAQLERERDDQARIAAAAERARIAREIHDIVAHSLSVVVVLTKGASLNVRRDPERAEHTLNTVENTTRSALTEMRRMLDVLRDPEPGSHAPQPGTAQLEQLISEAKSASLPVELAVLGVPRQLPSGVDLTIYRVVQEALTNVRKHAGSVTRVEVYLTYRHEDVEVRISDDGGGSTGANGGHGLIGMRERVTASGGELRLRSEDGFEVVARLPLEGTT